MADSHDERQELGYDESAHWGRGGRLTADAQARRRREVVCKRELHELLLRAARREVRRRSAGSPVTGRELDDLATQAADDATYSVLAKVDQFRGESRFTTWAYRFVVLEVSNKLGRHFWRQPRAELAEQDWERLPDALGTPPDHVVEVRELTRAVRRAVDDLTDHQRRVFEAAVLQGTCRSTPWRSGSTPPATPCTRRPSMLDVGSGPTWSPTGICRAGEHGAGVEEVRTHE